MKLEEIKFKFNKNKLEFLNVNQFRSKSNIQDIYSIRFGQRNPNICFINLKDKSSTKLELNHNDEIYYFYFDNVRYYIPKSLLTHKAIVQFQKQ